MVEKRVKKFGQGSPPPPFSGNARKKTFFLSGGLPLVVIIISWNMKTLPNRLLLNNKMQDFPARYSGKLWNAAWLLDNHPSPRRKHCFVLKLFAVCCLLNTVSYSSSAKLILRQLFCTAGGVQAKTGAIVECRNTIVGWVLVRKIGNCQIVSAWGVKAV